MSANDLCIGNEYNVQLNDVTQNTSVNKAYSGPLLDLSNWTSCYPCELIVFASNRNELMKPSTPVLVWFGPIVVTGFAMDKIIQVNWSVPQKMYNLYEVQLFTPVIDSSQRAAASVPNSLFRLDWPTGTHNFSVLRCGQHEILLVKSSSVKQLQFNVSVFPINIKKLEVLVPGTPSETIELNVTNHDSCLDNQYNVLIKSGLKTRNVKPSQSGSMLKIEQDMDPCFPCDLTVYVKDTALQLEPSKSIRVWFGRIHVEWTAKDMQLNVNWLIPRENLDGYFVRVAGSTQTNRMNPDDVTFPIRMREETTRFDLKSCGFHQLIIGRVIKTNFSEDDSATTHSTREITEYKSDVLIACKRVSIEEIPNTEFNILANAATGISTTLSIKPVFLISLALMCSVIYTY